MYSTRMGYLTTRVIPLSHNGHDYRVFLNNGHTDDGLTDEERELDMIECVHRIDCVDFGTMYDWDRYADGEDYPSEVDEIMQRLNFGQLDSGAFTPTLAFGEREGH